jgi:hypothetical protein
VYRFLSLFFQESKTAPLHFYMLVVAGNAQRRNEGDSFLSPSFALNERLRKLVQETLQAVPLSLKDVGAVLVVVQAPLKPGSELAEAPGAIEPL